jgi:lipoic acid synthetase
LTKFAVFFIFKDYSCKEEHKKVFIMRLPEWIRVKNSRSFRDTKKVLRSYGLSTVCEKARCPNMGTCFTRPTATFMILGSKCTRHCGFCSIDSSIPDTPNPREPQSVAMAAKEMGLRHVVITSVTRDDLTDGGAQHFAYTVYAIRAHIPHATVEVLTPDFKGDIRNLHIVLESRPDVYNHNVETVPRLYQRVRPGANYQRSLNVLRKAKETAPEIILKSGLMMGLGETREEVLDVLRDLHSTGCECITIGQYLRPSKRNLPVTEYVRPEIFEEIRLKTLDMGFRHVASAPLVRSSMNAEEMVTH